MIVGGWLYLQMQLYLKSGPDGMKKKKNLVSVSPRTLNYVFGSGGWTLTSELTNLLTHWGIISLQWVVSSDRKSHCVKCIGQSSYMALHGLCIPLRIYVEPRRLRPLQSVFSFLPSLLHSQRTCSVPRRRRSIVFISSPLISCEFHNRNKALFFVCLGTFKSSVVSLSWSNDRPNVSVFS